MYKLFDYSQPAALILENIGVPCGTKLSEMLKKRPYVIIARYRFTFPRFVLLLQSYTRTHTHTYTHTSSNIHIRYITVKGTFYTHR